MKSFIKKESSLLLPQVDKTLLVDLHLLEKKLNHAFLSKNIFVTKSSIIQNNDFLIIKLSLFYGTFRLIKYRKRVKLRKEKLKKKSLKKKYLFNKFLNSVVHGQRGNLLLKLKNVNLEVDENSLSSLYFAMDKFLPILFTRGLNLFLDFLKLTYLISKNSINVDVYLISLGKIFRVLHKKKHNRFVFFIRSLFEHLLNENESQICGLRMVINGKLLGKTRSSTVKIEKGVLNMNTVDSNLIFKKLHVYTLYGAFGLNLWINYKKENAIHT